MANYLDSRRIMGTDNPNGSFATPTALTDWNSRKKITVNGAKKTADAVWGTNADQVIETFATYTDQSDADTSWVSADTTMQRANPTTDVLDWNTKRDNTANEIYYDLGSTISDTAWVLRFKIRFDQISRATSSPTTGYFGISDNTSSSVTTQDFIGVGILQYTSGDNIYLLDADGAVIPTTTSPIPQVFVIDTDYYCEIKRLSATKAIAIFYRDSQYTEVINSVSATIPSTITNLRYFKVANPVDVSNANELNGTIDDIEFYDGVTTVENIPSQQTATFTDDFSTDKGWVVNDSNKINVDYTTNNRIDYDIIRDDTNDKAYIDLGSTVSDTAWVLRFHHYLTTFSGSINKQMMIGLSDNTGSSSVTLHDVIYMNLNLQDSRYYLHSVDNAITGSSSSSYLVGLTPTSSQEFWFELKRTSATTATLTAYSDSTYSTVAYTTNYSVASTTDNLRYIFVDHKQNPSADSGTLVGYIDDIEFYNGVSEVNPSTITDYVLPIKIQGDADLKRKTTETSEQLFNTDNFTDADSTNIGVNTTTQRLEFDIKRDGTNDGSALDLGSTLSDTKWRVDYDLHLTTLTESGNSQILHIGLSDGDETVASGTNQDAFTLRMDVWSGGQITTFADSEAQNLEGTVLHTFTDLVINTNYYISMLRYSATQCRMIIFADKARTIISQDTGVVTTTSGVGGLQYFKVTNGGGTTQTGAIIGYIENLRIWDNTTNPVEQETATKSDDFTSYADQTSANNAWVPNDNTAGHRVNITSDLIEHDISSDGSNDSISYDLGFIADDQWCLRWEWTARLQTSFPQPFVGLYSNDSATANNSSQSAITSTFGSSTTAFDRLQIREAVNESVDDLATAVNGTAGMTNLANNTTYYMELKRNKNIATYSVYDDSNYSIIHDNTSKGSVSIAIPNTLTNLRYIKLSHRMVTNATRAEIDITKVEFWNGITSPNASGRKIVFTNDDTTNSAIQYPSKTLSYDPINGDYYGEVKIPTLTTGSNFNLYMYHNYSPSANPDYVPDDSTVTLVQSATNTLTQNTSSDTSGVGWSQADSGGAGLRIVAGHALVGKKISSFTVYMKYATSNSSPAQNMVCKHFGSTPSIVRSTASETPSSSTLTTSYQTYTYNFASPVTIQANDHIMVVGDTDGGGGSWHFDIEGADGDANINFTTWADNSSTFTEQTNRELRYTLTYFESGNREQSVHDANYKGVWYLDGNSFDSTLYGNNGTNTSVDWTEQNNDVGLLANGTTTGIDVGSDSSLANIFSGGGHISAIINPKSDGEGNNGMILHKRTSDGWQFLVTGESGGFVKIQFLRGFSTTDGFWTTTNLVIPLNEVSFVDVFYNEDSVNNDPIIKVNGITQAITEGATPAGTASSETSETLHIADSSGSTNSFDGFISNLKVSDKIRPSSQAIATYNAEKSDSDILTVGSESTPLFSNVETNSIFIKTDTNKRFWYNGTTWVEQA